MTQDNNQNQDKRSDIIYDDKNQVIALSPRNQELIRLGESVATTQENVFLLKDSIPNIHQSLNTTSESVHLLTDNRQGIPELNTQLNALKEQDISTSIQRTNQELSTTSKELKNVNEGMTSAQGALGSTFKQAFAVGEILKSALLYPINLINLAAMDMRKSLNGAVRTLGNLTYAGELMAWATIIPEIPKLIQVKEQIKDQLNDVDLGQTGIAISGFDSNIFSEFNENLRFAGKGMFLDSEKTYAVMEKSVGMAIQLKDLADYIGTLKLATTGLESQDIADRLHAISAELDYTKTAAELAYSTYDILSAGMGDLGDNFEATTNQIVSQISKYSQLTKAPQDGLQRAVIYILKAYNQGAGEISGLLSELDTMIQKGIVQASDIENMSRVFSSAAVIGIDRKEVMAAMAQLTTKLNPYEAITALNALLMTFVNKQPMMVDALRRLNLELDLANKGILQTVSEINEAAKGNVEVIKEIARETNAFIGFSNLTQISQDEIKELQQTFADASAEGAGFIDEQWERYTSRLDVHSEIIQNKYDSIMTKVGESLMSSDIFSKGMNRIESLLDHVLKNPFFTEIIKIIVSINLGVNKFMALLGSLLQGMGALLGILATLVLFTRGGAFVSGFVKGFKSAAHSGNIFKQVVYGIGGALKSTFSGKDFRMGLRLFFDTNVLDKKINPAKMISPIRVLKNSLYGVLDIFGSLIQKADVLRIKLFNVFRQSKKINPDGQQILTDDTIKQIQSSTNVWNRSLMTTRDIVNGISFSFKSIGKLLVDIGSGLNVFKAIPNEVLGYEKKIQGLVAQSNKINPAALEENRTLAFANKRHEIISERIVNQKGFRETKNVASGETIPMVPQLANVKSAALAYKQSVKEYNPNNISHPDTQASQVQVIDDKLKRLYSSIKTSNKSLDVDLDKSLIKSTESVSQWLQGNNNFDLQKKAVGEFLGSTELEETHKALNTINNAIANIQTKVKSTSLDSKDALTDFQKMTEAINVLQKQQDLLRGTAKQDTSKSLETVGFNPTGFDNEISESRNISEKLNNEIADLQKYRNSLSEASNGFNRERSIKELKLPKGEKAAINKGEFNLPENMGIEKFIQSISRAESSLAERKNARVAMSSNPNIANIFKNIDNLRGSDTESIVKDLKWQMSQQPQTSPQTKDYQKVIDFVQGGNFSTQSQINDDTNSIQQMRQTLLKFELSEQTRIEKEIAEKRKQVRQEEDRQAALGQRRSLKEPSAEYPQQQVQENLKEIEQRDQAIGTLRADKVDLQNQKLAAQAALQPIEERYDPVIGKINANIEERTESDNQLSRQIEEKEAQRAAIDEKKPEYRQRIQNEIVDSGIIQQLKGKAATAGKVVQEEEQLHTNNKLVAEKRKEFFTSRKEDAVIREQALRKGFKIGAKEDVDKLSTEAAKKIESIQKEINGNRAFKQLKEIQKEQENLTARKANAKAITGGISSDDAEKFRKEEAFLQTREKNLSSDKDVKRLIDAQKHLERLNTLKKVTQQIKDADAAIQEEDKNIKKLNKPSEGLTKAKQEQARAENNLALASKIKEREIERTKADEAKKKQISEEEKNLKLKQEKVRKNLERAKARKASLEDYKAKKSQPYTTKIQESETGIKEIDTQLATEEEKLAKNLDYKRKAERADRNVMSDSLHNQLESTKTLIIAKKELMDIENHLRESGIVKNQEQMNYISTQKAQAFQLLQNSEKMRKAILEEIRLTQLNTTLSEKERQTKIDLLNKNLAAINAVVDKAKDYQDMAKKESFVQAQQDLAKGAVNLIDNYGDRLPGLGGFKDTIVTKLKVLLDTQGLDKQMLATKELITQQIGAINAVNTPGSGGGGVQIYSDENFKNDIKNVEGISKSIADNIQNHKQISDDITKTEADIKQSKTMLEEAKKASTNPFTKQAWQTGEQEQVVKFLEEDIKTKESTVAQGIGQLRAIQGEVLTLSESREKTEANIAAKQEFQQSKQELESAEKTLYEKTQADSLGENKKTVTGIDEKIAKKDSEIQKLNDQKKVETEKLNQNQVISEETDKEQKRKENQAKIIDIENQINQEKQKKVGNYNKIRELEGESLKIEDEYQKQYGEKLWGKPTGQLGSPGQSPEQGGFEISEESLKREAAREKIGEIENELQAEKEKPWLFRNDKKTQDLESEKKRLKREYREEFGEFGEAEKRELEQTKAKDAESEKAKLRIAEIDKELETKEKEKQDLVGEKDSFEESKVANELTINEESQEYKEFQEKKQGFIDKAKATLESNPDAFDEKETERIQSVINNLEQGDFSNKEAMEGYFNDINNFTQDMEKNIATSQKTASELVKDTMTRDYGEAVTDIVGKTEGIKVSEGEDPQLAIQENEGLITTLENQVKSKKNQLNQREEFLSGVSGAEYDPNKSVIEEDLALLTKLEDKLSEIKKKNAGGMLTQEDLDEYKELAIAAKEASTFGVQNAEQLEALRNEARETGESMGFLEKTWRKLNGTTLTHVKGFATNIFGGLKDKAQEQWQEIIHPPTNVLREEVTDENGVTRIMETTETQWGEWAKNMVGKVARVGAAFTTLGASEALMFRRIDATTGQRITMLRTLGGLAMKAGQMMANFAIPMVVTKVIGVMVEGLNNLVPILGNAAHKQQMFNKNMEIAKEKVVSPLNNEYSKMTDEIEAINKKQTEYMTFLPRQLSFLQYFTGAVENLGVAIENHLGLKNIFDGISNSFQNLMQHLTVITSDSWLKSIPKTLNSIGTGITTGINSITQKVGAKIKALGKSSGDYIEQTLIRWDREARRGILQTVKAIGQEMLTLGENTKKAILAIQQLDPKAIESSFDDYVKSLERSATQIEAAIKSDKRGKSSYDADVSENRGRLEHRISNKEEELRLAENRLQDFFEKYQDKPWWVVQNRLGDYKTAKSVFPEYTEKVDSLRAEIDELKSQRHDLKYLIEEDEISTAIDIQGDLLTEKQKLLIAETNRLFDLESIIAKNNSNFWDNRVLNEQRKHAEISVRKLEKEIEDIKTKSQELDSYLANSETDDKMLDDREKSKKKIAQDIKEITELKDVVAKIAREGIDIFGDSEENVFEQRKAIDIFYEKVAAQKIYEAELKINAAQVALENPKLTEEEKSNFQKKIDAARQEVEAVKNSQQAYKEYQDQYRTFLDQFAAATKSGLESLKAQRVEQELLNKELRESIDLTKEQGAIREARKDKKSINSPLSNTQSISDVDKTLEALSEYKDPKTKEDHYSADEKVGIENARYFNQEMGKLQNELIDIAEQQDSKQVNQRVESVLGGLKSLSVDYATFQTEKGNEERKNVQKRMTENITSLLETIDRDATDFEDLAPIRKKLVSILSSFQMVALDEVGKIASNKEYVGKKGTQERETKLDNILTENGFLPSQMNPAFLFNLEKDYPQYVAELNSLESNLQKTDSGSYIDKQTGQELSEKEVKSTAKNLFDNNINEKQNLTIADIENENHPLSDFKDVLTGFTFNAYKKNYPLSESEDAWTDSTYKEYEDNRWKDLTSFSNRYFDSAYNRQSRQIKDVAIPEYDQGFLDNPNAVEEFIENATAEQMKMFLETIPKDNDANIQNANIFKERFVETRTKQATKAEEIYPEEQQDWYILRNILSADDNMFDELIKGMKEVGTLDDAQIQTLVETRKNFNTVSVPQTTDIMGAMIAPQDNYARLERDLENIDLSYQRLIDSLSQHSANIEILSGDLAGEFFNREDTTAVNQELLEKQLLVNKEKLAAIIQSDMGTNNRLYKDLLFEREEIIREGVEKIVTGKRIELDAYKEANSKQAELLEKDKTANTDVYSEEQQQKIDLDIKKRELLIEKAVVAEIDLEILQAERMQQSLTSLLAEEGISEEKQKQLETEIKLFSTVLRNLKTRKREAQDIFALQEEQFKRQESAYKRAIEYQQIIAQGEQDIRGIGEKNSMISANNEIMEQQADLTGKQEEASDKLADNLKRLADSSREYNEIELERQRQLSAELEKKQQIEMKILELKEAQAILSGKQLTIEKRQGVFSAEQELNEALMAYEAIADNENIDQSEKDTAAIKLRGAIENAELAKEALTLSEQSLETSKVSYDEQKRILKQNQDRGILEQQEALEWAEAVTKGAGSDDLNSISKKFKQKYEALNETQKLENKKSKTLIDFQLSSIDSTDKTQELGRKSGGDTQMSSTTAPDSPMLEMTVESAKTGQQLTYSAKDMDELSNLIWAPDKETQQMQEDWHKLESQYNPNYGRKRSFIWVHQPQEEDYEKDKLGEHTLFYDKEKIDNWVNPIGGQEDETSVDMIKRGNQILNEQRNDYDEKYKEPSIQSNKKTANLLATNYHQSELNSIIPSSGGMGRKDTNSFAPTLKEYNQNIITEQQKLLQSSIANALKDGVSAASIQISQTLDSIKPLLKPNENNVAQQKQNINTINNTNNFEFKVNGQDKFNPKDFETQISKGVYGTLNTLIDEINRRG